MNTIRRFDGGMCLRSRFSGIRSRIRSSLYSYVLRNYLNSIASQDLKGERF